MFASGLDEPFGLAFYPPGPDPQWLYVAMTKSVVRFPYLSGDLRARGKAQTIVARLPSGGHATRDVAFSNDGTRMFVSIGSASNAAEGMRERYPEGLQVFEAQHGLGASWGRDTDRALVLAFDPEGRGRKTFATTGEAAQREQAALAAFGLTDSSFNGFGKMLQGTRRHNLIYLGDLAADVEPDGLRISFALPAGSYATVLLRELMKTDA